jgi:hypothetical protein
MPVSSGQKTLPPIPADVGSSLLNCFRISEQRVAFGLEHMLKSTEEATRES